MRALVTATLLLLLAAPGCTLFFDPSRLNASDAGPIADARFDANTDANTDARTDARDDADTDGGAPPDCSPLPRGMTTLFAYRDHRCGEREVEFQNDSLLLDGASYRTAAGETRTARGEFGMVTVPFDLSWVGGSSYGTGTAGTTEWLLRAEHHAVRSTRFPLDNGGQMLPSALTVTVHWFVAAGRDPFVYAITYDASAFAADTFRGGSWAPTGPLHFHGRAPGSVTMAGMAWGDQRVFRTRGDVLSDASGWDYTEPASIPFTQKWSLDPDAEVGLVQTETQQQHPGGDDSGDMSSRWGTSSGSGLPHSDTWAYYMGQYDEEGTTGTRPTVGWGLNRGGVGLAQFPEYGYAAGGDYHRGHPSQSYSLFVVLGAHSESAVAATIADVDALTATAVTATAGTLATMAPAGVGDPTARTLDPVGYDPRYAIYRATADTSGAAPTLVLRFDVPSAKTLRSPVLCIEGMTMVREVRVDGAELGTDRILASRARTAPTPADLACAWVTLRTDLASGAHEVEIRGE